MPEFPPARLQPRGRRGHPRPRLSRLLTPRPGWPGGRSSGRDLAQFPIRVRANRPGVNGQIVGGSDADVHAMVRCRPGDRVRGGPRPSRLVRLRRLPPDRGWPWARSSIASQPPTLSQGPCAATSWPRYFCRPLRRGDYPWPSTRAMTRAAGPDRGAAWSCGTWALSVGQDGSPSGNEPGR